MMTPNQWLITTFKSPVVFNRGREETWYLNPVRRYVFNAGHILKMAEHVETTSDLRSGALYRPLNARAALAGRRILIERFRDRGLGDLLFLTGPMAFLHHITGGDVKIHTYAYSDRGTVLYRNPHLEFGTALVGPTHYDDFGHYDYQWMVEAVTETDQEPDQLNVYDALYRQMGLNPDQVPALYKRPTMALDPEDAKGLIQFFFLLWQERQIDLRRTGYYVVAPTTHSPLRMASYGFWIALIKELALRRPVVVIGNLHESVPDLDMPIGQFRDELDQLGAGVVNLLGKPYPLRSVIQLISKSTCLIGLDSGPLYIAQGLRIPAISLWGPHDPRVRIGYDKDYMDLAVWNSQYCNNCPCFCYGSLPKRKCPQGENQTLCEILCSLIPDDVLTKLDMVESRGGFSLGTFSPAIQNEATTATT